MAHHPVIAVSVKVAELTRGASKAMLTTKLETAMAVALVVLAAATFPFGAATGARLFARGDVVKAAADGESDRPNEDGDDLLTVQVDPRNLQVRPKEPFEVRLRVINSSQAAQSLRVMNCSWDEEWKSSNVQVTWVGWDCAKNFQVTEKLDPGQAYEKKLSMLLLAGEAGKKVSFKMGFTSIGSKRTYWSNQVTLHVKPDEAVRQTEPKNDQGRKYKMETESLQGVWRIHSVDFHELRNRVKPSLWEFNKNKVILNDEYFGGMELGRPPEGTFKLGGDENRPEKGQAASIDVTLPLAARPGILEGKQRSVILKGVYGWNGDKRLKLCFRLTDGDRPTNLLEQAEKGFISLELEYGGPPTKSAEEAHIDSLKRALTGRIKPGQSGEAAEKSIEAMKDLVINRAVSVKGMKVEQLEYIVGTPAVKEQDGSVSYRFDTGFGGETWVFSVKDGRITDWVVKKLE